MEIEAQPFPFWQLVRTFIKGKKLQIIKIKSNNEVWLQEEGRQRAVYRLVEEDASIPLIQKDIKETKKKLEILRQDLGLKSVVCHTIYVTSQANTVKIEGEKLLKEPDSPTKVKPFFMDKENYSAASVTLRKHLKLKTSPTCFSQPTIKEEQVHQQAVMNEWSRQKKLEERRDIIFSFGNPYLTTIIISFLTVVFLTMELSGSSTEARTLIAFGAKDNALIMGGEWWRLLTSMFLHIGIIHLVLNGVALFFLGGIVERVFGSARFLVIFLFSGLIGSLASFIFTADLAAGASGAIFGCFGAILYLLFVDREMFLYCFGYRFLALLGVNVAIGFSLPFIDMGAILEDW